MLQGGLFEEKIAVASQGKARKRRESTAHHQNHQPAVSWHIILNDPNCVTMKTPLRETMTIFNRLTLVPVGEVKDIPWVICHPLKKGVSCSR
ncbi:hypothetical protein CgunFtcFv8_016757 [Champsocephalus gunnari]|uniref:Uncharacterized protein n=1 Tax=Champsocephalus gunnari TaxID=52237 RepID=A0AAN8HDP4_CHAGU|nr:hypothetical protein CgunFtcFv8_016757 [Champsocephalus gunnari]